MGDYYGEKRKESIEGEEKEDYREVKSLLKAQEYYRKGKKRKTIEKERERRLPK